MSKGGKDGVIINKEPPRKRGPSRTGATALGGSYVE